MDRALPEEWRGPLQLVGELAVREGTAAYLVGGAVRDVLLGRPVLDVDVALEGAVPEVAAALASALGGRAVVHERFGTAKVSWDGGRRSLDLATTRKERYRRPGALPEVEPGNIEEDLRRRDFTINAMALDLRPASWGALIDPTGGLEDLSQGLIRVLHEASFQDDATRILRAVRYEQRLGFRIEPLTEGWLRRDVGYLATISGDRLRHELFRILEEERPERALARAGECGALTAMVPGLTFDAEQERLLRRARCPEVKERFEEARSLYLALWLWTMPPEVVTALCERLNFPVRERRLAHEVLELRALLPALSAPNASDAAIARLLDGRRPEAIAALVIAEGGAAAERAWRYWTVLRQRRPALRGDDVLRLGVPAGPAVGEVLERLREARWNGEVTSRQEEERLVHRWLQERARA